MFDQIKRLAKHSAIYGVGGVVSRLLAVVLLPIYTAYLEPDDLGSVGAFYSDFRQLNDREVAALLDRAARRKGAG